MNEIKGHNFFDSDIEKAILHFTANKNGTSVTIELRLNPDASNVLLERDDIIFLAKYLGLIVFEESSKL